MMNVLENKSIKRWVCATAVSLPLLASQAILPTLSGGYFSASVMGVAHAEEEKKPERKTKRTQAMNQKVYKKLQKIQELIDAKDNKGALAALKEFEADSKNLNDAEMATTLNLYAFIYYNLEDIEGAIGAYKRLVVLPLAPEGMKLQAKYSLAQMYFAVEKFDLGIKSLLDWFKETEIAGASAYVLLAQGYYQVKEYDKSLTNVNKAIAMYKEKGKIPKEAWYGLQRFLYQEKKDYNKVISILDELLTHYPKKQYWSQLSAMYGEKEMPKKQLAAYETAYVQGLLDKENELTRMAYIFLANEVPYKAAKVVSEGLKQKKIEETSKNYELLGNALRAAQEVEKAIPNMTKAAKLSDKGELWVRLGTLYLSTDKFKNAVEAIEAGLKKGGVKRNDQAYLALGMSYFNLKDYSAAKKAFRKAGTDERSEQTAEQWLKYMDKELERQRSLAQG